MNHGQSCAGIALASCALFASACAAAVETPSERDVSRPTPRVSRTPFETVQAGSATSGVPAPMQITGAAGRAAATPTMPIAQGNRLSVHFEEVASQLAVSSVTIACGEPCVGIVAVPDGGNPEYSFTWSDGVTGAGRMICAEADRTFSVTVSDTPIEAQEFGYAGQTVTAELKMRVLGCAATPPPPPQPPSTDPCIENPSFEGTPQFNPPASTTTFVAPPWQACPGGSPDIWNETQSWFGAAPGPKPSAGATYLQLYHVPLALDYELTSQSLCAPMTAGKKYALKLDMMFQTAGAFDNATPGNVELVASMGLCAEGQVLWKSPEASPAWTTYCVDFTAQQAFTHFTVRPTPTTTSSAVFVDNIVVVPSCDHIPQL